MVGDSTIDTTDGMNGSTSLAFKIYDHSLPSEPSNSLLVYSFIQTVIQFEILVLLILYEY